ncbi:nucleotide exchange factor GrpE [Paenibacillus sp. RC67]|uniref:nucleotide exchange factor GrpE n=1 Tax=Paenibacillus sp. RC67 TaxID=3039392 RepID=UPI0024AE8289|nr:nucleotide exchange factor GrpE [Paenibacillus sp. RC67]
MSTEQKNQFENQADNGPEVDATYNEDADTAANQQQETASEQDGELEQLRQLAEEHYQRSIRAQADFDNFRRRTRQEKEEFAKYASLKVVEQLLPVVDNFERALAASKDSNDYDALLKGVEMIFRQLDQALANEGLKAMDAVGQPFNPEFHQAIMQVESDEYEEGIVVEEVQKGYMLKDKVLRPAMVKVSS